jgi:hypothetical protein
LLAVEIDFLHPAYNSEEEALKLSMENITAMLGRIRSEQNGRH